MSNRKIIIAAMKEAARQRWQLLVNKPVTKLCKECYQPYEVKPREDVGFCSAKCHYDFEHEKIIQRLSDTQ